ncbi:MAG: hypothetical protein ACHRHE_22715, partial [Tepidisphaerales bacterium]
MLLSSPAELISGLPPFVFREKTVQRLEPQGWDKPVIWFHGPDGTRVSVEVMAKQGFVTANFPGAQLLTRRYSHTDRKAMMVSLLTEAAGYRWEGTLTRAPAAKVPEVAKDHWWQIARDAGGQYFNAKGGSERFIFYEATAFQEPVVSAKVTAEAITIRNTYDAPTGQVIVLVNAPDKHYVRVVDTIGANAELQLGKDEILKGSCSAESVLAACAGQWTSFGMTEPEGKAIAAVWREDLLKSNRFLLISRMPVRLYDAMFPLNITPSPGELVRVGLVFDAMDRQSGAASWLPLRQDIQQAVAKAASGLGNDDWKKRDQASEELARLGNQGRA